MPDAGKPPRRAHAQRRRANHVIVMVNSKSRGACPVWYVPYTVAGNQASPTFMAMRHRRRWSRRAYELEGRHESGVNSGKRDGGGHA